MSLMQIESLERRQLFATLAVTTLDDSGAGSLRDVINNAVADDIIDASAISGTITLSSGISIEKDLTIIGPGRDALVISGNDAIRPFALGAGTIEISGLTITQGYTTSSSGAMSIGNGSNVTLTDVALTDSHANSTGGAILIAGGGHLTMFDSVVSGNSSYANGGGIFASVNSTISLTRCLITSNSVYGMARDFMEEGGFAEGGGLELLGTSATLINCTITDNTLVADDYTGEGGFPGDAAGFARGAGILMGNGAIVIRNSTIVNNAATASDVSGGGINWMGNGSLTMTNTIIAGNAGGNHPDAYIPPGGTRTISHSIIGAFAFTGITDGVDGNIVGTVGSPINPMFGVLTDNGGPTLTHALPPDSIAVDAGTPTGAPTDDQRGLPRDETPDIGAYEVVDATPEMSEETSNVAFANVVFEYQVSFTGPLDLPLHITAEDVPNWLRLVSTDNGIATFRGLPTILNEGTFEIELRVNNGLNTLVHAAQLHVFVPSHHVSEAGQLTVHGTADADTILIAPRGGNLLRLVRNGEARNLYADQITSIQILTYDGNDIVSVETGGIGVYVLGGAGNDTITGGSQADTLVGAGSKDLIYGMGGDDWLYGSAGNDVLFGGEGNDRVNGGDANDILDGGSGRDRLDGGEGDDYIHAYDRRPDYVFGGNGTDTAWLDSRLATDITFGDLETIAYLDA